MFITKTLSRARLHPKTILVSAIICLLLTAFVSVDAASSLLSKTSIAAPRAALDTNPAAGAVASALPQWHVLSDRDDSLYRAAFAAQARHDLATADLAISNLADKRLLGHVLADRYLRAKPSAEALKAWLAAYADHPEASDIYDMLRADPAMKGIKVTAPRLADQWSGSDNYGASLGFKIADNSDRGTLVAAPEAQHAATLFFDDKIDEAYKVAATSAGHSPLSAWIAGLTAWKKGDANMAALYFAKAANDKRLSGWDRAAASFWAYRATKRSGNNDQAYVWLRRAAEQPRSFYGLLANELLGRKPKWAWQVPEPKAASIAALAEYPAGNRALALIQVGQSGLAEDELSRLNPRGHRDVQEAMLYFADKAGMPSLALRLGGMVTNTSGKPYDAALYPLPPWQPPKGFNVDRALIYALMRHESRFDTMAVSGRGACGLMQLMPTTASLAAGQQYVKKASCTDQVMEPAMNMDLGQKYVQMLAGQAKIGDNLVLLLAAYNSGPGKIARWMDGDVSRDPLLFMESLPVRETRDYVQNVMMHYWIYRARLDQPETSMAQLARGEWPRYVLNDSPTTLAAAPVAATGFEVASNE